MSLKSSQPLVPHYAIEKREKKKSEKNVVISKNKKVNELELWSTLCTEEARRGEKRKKGEGREREEKRIGGMFSHEKCMIITPRWR